MFLLKCLICLCFCFLFISWHANPNYIHRYFVAQGYFYFNCGFFLCLFFAKFPRENGAIKMQIFSLSSSALDQIDYIKAALMPSGRALKQGRVHLGGRYKQVSVAKPHCTDSGDCSQDSRFKNVICLMLIGCAVRCHARVCRVKRCTAMTTSRPTTCQQRLSENVHRHGLLPAW